MPPVSQAPRRWAQANKDTNPAAAEFAAADDGRPLPERARKPARSKSKRSGHEREAAGKIIKRLNARDTSR